MLHQSRIATVPFVVAAVLAVPAIAAPAAVAVPGTGSMTLAIGGEGNVSQALYAAEVKVGAAKPAKRRGKRVTLPVAKVSVGKAATVALRGGIRFEAGKRALALRSLRLKLLPRRASVSAKVGKRRVPVFVAKLAKGSAKLDRSRVSARLARTTLSLTAKGAAALRRGLALEALGAGTLGTLGVNARRKATSGDGKGNGPGGGDGPKSGPISKAPPVLARPPSAVDASNVSIVWYPRDSWIRYVSSGVGLDDGFFVSGGATKAAPTNTASHPCSDDSYPGSGTFDYRYDFAVKPGSWYDPVSGTAALYGQGSVRFRWAEHGIDLTAADPEIELNGSSSRAIFRFVGGANTAIPSQRAVLTTLDMAGQPTSAGGGAFTYSTMRGDLTEDGESIFAGYYVEGVGFGCVTASFST